MDHLYWQNVLLKWLQKNSLENRKTAIYALHSFHKEVSNQIELRKNATADLDTLKFYINFFKFTLQSSTSQSFEIRIAIRGFGVMAGACKALLPPEILNDLVTLVIQRTEYSTIGQRSDDKSLLEHYPDFVQALSEIMQHIVELTSIQCSSLENIIIALIKDFYYLSTAHHLLTVNSLLKTFKNLSRLDGSILESVLERVVLQGVIWTCAHKLVYDSNVEWSTIADWKEHITYISFLPLWIGLLKDAECQDAEGPVVQHIVYRHLMGALFTILGKLNLNTSKRKFKDIDGKEQELFFCDPNIELIPVKPKDFHIFFNVVQFYGDVLLSVNVSSHIKIFQPFMAQYCELMVAKSIRYPLVSGFVRLMEIALNIAGKIKMFDNIDRHKQLNDTIISFVQLQIVKAQQTFGELQITCLEMIFTVPTPILKNVLLDLRPVFIIAFDIGKSMLSIAAKALRVLIRFGEEFKHNSQDWQRLLQSVLPCLDSYLQSNGFTVGDGLIDVEIIKTNRARTRANKILLKDNTSVESDLLKFQKDIVIFLGE